jgi:hypothetical protein
VAGQVLADAGADLERVRAEVVRLLAEYRRRTGSGADGGQGQGDGDGGGQGGGGGAGAGADRS